MFQSSTEHGNHGSTESLEAKIEPRVCRLKNSTRTRPRSRESHRSFHLTSSQRCLICFSSCRGSLSLLSPTLQTPSSGFLAVRNNNLRRPRGFARFCVVQLCFLLSGPLSLATSFGPVVGSSLLSDDCSPSVRKRV